MKRRIAIVEDTKTDQEFLVSSIERYSKEQGLEFDVSVFDSGTIFLDSFAPIFDLIFIDIRMPGIDGMETTKRIREIDDKVSLVFCTTLAQYALFGYQVNALDFLVKPLTYETFATKFTRILPLLKEREEPSLIFQNKEGSVALKKDQLYYVEVIGHNVVLHTSKGEFSKRMSMSSLINDPFFSSGFSMCNQCYFVNLRFVEKVIGNEVLMKGGDTLLISRPKKQSFLSDLSNYFLKGK